MRQLLFIMALLVFLSPTGHALADTKHHKVVLHVDENDKARMNLVLNNASNVTSYYMDKAEEITIEIVAYGPGLNMLVQGKSPVADRVKVLSENYDNISFKGCGNTHAKMSKKAGKQIPLLPQTQMVTSGVVHLIQRQEEGWSYVRP